jgi:hypothetical protein
MTSVRSTEPSRGMRGLSQDDAREIAVEAYIYAFPLVLMQISRRTATNIAAPSHRKAPVNRFGHMQSFPDATFKDGVLPNVDTLFSVLWFDVSSEPLVIQKPDSGGRYHLLPILDMWTDVFASPGSRTTGDGAETFAIVGPRWRGSLPNGIECLVSPTEQGWINGRTQTNGIGDYSAVHEFQNALTACPLSRFGGTCKMSPSHVDANVPATPPLKQLEAMDAAGFFSLFAELSRPNPPHAQDQPVLARMARAGLEPGKAFVLSELPSPLREAFEAAPGFALEKLKQEIFRTGNVVNGWRFIDQPMGTYGADYLHRASVAYNALGANVAEDTSYLLLTTDADGKWLDGNFSYAIRFERDQLPPVHAFWSLTVYDEHRLLAHNAINRYALSGRDDLSFNADGTVDLWIQRGDPGEGKTANWLPSPRQGPFSLVLRLYWPKPEAVSGGWRPPPITLVR